MVIIWKTSNSLQLIRIISTTSFKQIEAIFYKNLSYLLLHDNTALRIILTHFSQGSKKHPKNFKKISKISQNRPKICRIIAYKIPKLTF